MNYATFLKFLAKAGYKPGVWDDPRTRIFDNRAWNNRVSWEMDGQETPTNITVIIWSAKHPGNVMAGKLEWPVNVLGFAPLLELLPTLKAK